MNIDPNKTTLANADREPKIGDTVISGRYGDKGRVIGRYVMGRHNEWLVAVRGRDEPTAYPAWDLSILVPPSVETLAGDFTPVLTREHRNWMIENLGSHDDAVSLARACAEEFGLVDEHGDVVGDETVDGDGIQWGLWTHEETCEAHPVCAYADALCTLGCDDPKSFSRLVAAAAQVARTAVTDDWYMSSPIDAGRPSDLIDSISTLRSIMKRIDDKAAEGLDLAAYP